MIFYNAKRYRERSQPRPEEEVRKSIADFFSELDDLVQKHKVADLTICGRVNIVVPARDLTEEDGESHLTLVAHIGDGGQSVEMATHAYAYLRKEADQRVHEIRARAGKST